MIVLQATRARGDVVVVAASLVVAPMVGYVLARAGGRFGDLAPVAVLAFPLLPALALVVLARPAWGAAAVFVTLPVGLLEVPGVPLQLVQVVVLAASALVGLRRLAAGVPPLAWAVPVWWLAGLMVWFLVATPSAADADAAQRDVVLFATGLVFVCLLCAVCRTTASVRTVLVPLVTTVALVSLSTLGGAGGARAQFGGSVVRGRALGAFGQPNEFGTFCAVGGLLAIGLLFAARSLRGRVLAGASAAAIVVGLLLSLSRGAWIGFALGLVVLVATMREARRTVAVLALPVLVLAIAVGAFAPSNPQVEVVGARLQSITGEKNPYDDRPAIWREAVDLTIKDPLTGQGPGSFPTTSASVTSDSRTTFAHHAHNLALTLSAEAGVPAVLLLGGLVLHLGAASRRARRAARKADRPADAVLISALTAAGVAVLGQGLVDYTLRNAVLFLQAWGVIGLLAAVTRVESRTDRAL